MDCARAGANDRYRTERAVERCETPAIMRIIARLVGLALLSGCSTNPITGRDQILAIPGVQVAYAEAGFALSTVALRGVASASCEQGCGSAENLARFSARVATIGARLEASAR